ncbi:MAG: phospholipid carrier-dependent glycosyltransferase [Chloroflexi bacterium]|nr:phospholipid carrier-dependent glycosyltransferase [Chloroflexota bacterium]
MTRDSVRERGARPIERGLPLDPATLVLVLIVLGVLLRTVIGGLYLPFSGFRVDVGDFGIWASRLASRGPGEFYQPGYLADYPPGYMYVLWLIGGIGELLRPVFGLSITPGLVKVPGILADAGIAWLLFVYARRWGDGWLGSWSGERLGIVAVVIYLFNPGTIFDSAVWGQVDSVGTLVLLATLYMLARGWTEAAAAGAVLGMLVKFQFGFLIPLVAVVGIKRHFFGRSSDPDQAGRADPIRILTSLATGLGTLVLLILPFRLAIWAPADPTLSLVDRFIAASNTYKGLTVNAFNLWRNPWTGLGDVYRWGCDTLPPTCADGSGVAFTLGSTPISWQLVGALLFGVAALVALWTVAKRDDPAGLLVGALVLAVAFFALPTRVHERYLFPALALAAPLVARSWKWAVLYGALTLSFFLNVYWLYTTDFSFAGGDHPMNPGLGRLPMPRDPVLAAVVFNDTGIYLLSLMIVIALAWLLTRAITMALGVPEGGVRLAPPPIEVAPARQVPAVALEGALEPRRSRFPAWLRRDPSYREEPPRRLDRLDLVLLVAIVLVAFFFRLWRLEIPRHTHFDEVYHARSATEWLADWQEGWTRDTYEWTHPPLAKFLIAAGIVVADPNKVVGGTDLDAPATAMAVAPRRTAQARPDSIVFTSAGDEVITAREVLTGKQVASWSAEGRIAGLAYDDDGNRLLVGLASGGAVSSYDLTAFLGQLGERGPPPGIGQIETGLAGVTQIVIPDSQTVIIFAGPNGIVEVERKTGVELASTELVAAGIGYVPGGSGDNADPRVVAVDKAGSGLLLLDGLTLLPVMETVNNEQVEVVRTLPAPPAGPLLVQGSGKNLQIWVPVGPLPADDEHGPVKGGLSVFDESAKLIDTVSLPGAATAIGWQRVANIVYVAGIETRTGQPVVWAVQPLGNGGTQSAGFAAFDTSVLPGKALAMGFDISDDAQGDDHALLLVSTDVGDGGRLVSIDAGSNAFAWRIAGIVFGTVLVGIIYLFAATLFSRRRIAVLAAVFVAFDGMSYVMSRIAMNDIYAATFIVAAYALFWQIWSGRWARSAWWVLPLVGVMIGLAAATKWVGWYALIGLWVLVLARSEFGGFLLVAGIAFLTVVAGFGAPWPFLIVCIMALVLALLLVWRRPIRLSPQDILALPPIGIVAGGIGLAFAIAYSTVDGREPRSAVEFIFAFLARGAQAAWPAWIMLAVAGLLLAARAVRSLRAPASDRRWYIPGELGGFAWPWVGACLLVVPLLVYFIAYIPYLQLGHGIATQHLGPGYGWSLDEMQSQMFGYHFGLQAGHPAASPWWSWPLDLKPVWFYSHSYDDRLMAVIYNGGNPILVWAGIPAIGWCAVQAWRRRSLALTLLVAAFAFQYLPWTRIERATFHYHYFTAVLIAMIAVAYLVDEGLRSWAYRSLAIAFLVLAVVAGLLIFPLGSALAMPDWYINAARALAPWNYAFKFPDPPQGDRGQLLSADTLKLMIGLVVSLGAAAFALFGRDFFTSRRAAASPVDSASDPSGWAPEDVSSEDTEGDLEESQLAEPVATDVGHEPPRPDAETDRSGDSN